MERDDEVRCIAYSIWQEEGCPCGCEWEHWYRAEYIWERQQEQPAVSKSKSQPKRAAKPRTRVSATGKKS